MRSGLQHTRRQDKCSPHTNGEHSSDDYTDCIDRGQYWIDVPWVICIWLWMYHPLIYLGNIKLANLAPVECLWPWMCVCWALVCWHGPAGVCNVGQLCAVACSAPICSVAGDESSPGSHGWMLWLKAETLLVCSAAFWAPLSLSLSLSVPPGPMYMAPTQNAAVDSVCLCGSAVLW